MRPPPFKCLYCLSTSGSFSRIEHPIPESLGNDDLTLPRGYVCDQCNQYLGSKVEEPVLRKAPFGIERAFQAIKNKKGKYPQVGTPSLQMQSTGYWDRVLLYSDPPHDSIARLPDGRMVLNPQWAAPNEVVRFLLKLGLGLLVVAEEGDPYHPQHDLARKCARNGFLADEWDFAVGVYPNRDDLTKFVRYDLHGPLETRQIYQYEMGIMASGDQIFCLVFANWVFAVNLCRPPMLEYILGFNNGNSFKLESRWSLFRKQ